MTSSCPQNLPTWETHIKYALVYLLKNQKLLLILRYGVVASSFFPRFSVFKLFSDHIFFDFYFLGSFLYFKELIVAKNYIESWGQTFGTPDFFSTDFFPRISSPDFSSPDSFFPDLFPDLFSPFLDHRGVQGFIYKYKSRKKIQRYEIMPEKKSGHFFPEFNYTKLAIYRPLAR